MEMCPYTPNTWEMDARGSEIQGLMSYTLRPEPEARPDQSVNQMILKSRKYSKSIFYQGLDNNYEV